MTILKVLILVQLHSNPKRQLKSLDEFSELRGVD